MISLVSHHLIGGEKRVDVPRSCALVIHGITLVGDLAGFYERVKLRDGRGFSRDRAANLRDLDDPSSGHGILRRSQQGSRHLLQSHQAQAACSIARRG